MNKVVIKFLQGSAVTQTALGGLTKNPLGVVFALVDSDAKFTHHVRLRPMPK